jgi:hypothetical protein
MKPTQASLTARAKILAALERGQRAQAQRIAKLRKCDTATFEKALETFENPPGAGQWLTEWVNRLRMAKGREEVRRALGRIDHGVPS